MRTNTGCLLEESKRVQIKRGKRNTPYTCKDNGGLSKNIDAHELPKRRISKFSTIMTGVVNTGKMFLSGGNSS